MPYAVSTDNHAPVDAMWPLPERQRRELTLIRAARGSSRSSVSDELRIRKSTVSGDVNALIDAGLLREGDSKTSTPGRPRVPLEIDPDRLHMLGLSIDPGRVSSGRVNLTGDPITPLRVERAADAAGLVAAGTLAIGLIVPGFIDAGSGDVLFSSAFPEAGRVSLAPIRAAAAGRPLLMDSRTNSLGTRWLLQHPEAVHDDCLLIYLSDGQLGSTLMIDGRPIRGCVLGANELGHTRLGIDTPLCYCGQRGCIERIFTTPYLQSLDSDAGSLAEACAAAQPTPAVIRITELIAIGLSNAVNFCRVGRVTLITDLPGLDHYLDRLIAEVRKLVMTELVDRVQFEAVVEQPPHLAVAAASPALAELFLVSTRPAVAGI